MMLNAWSICFERKRERERTLWKTFVQSNAYSTLFVYKQHGKCAQHAAINVLHMLELEMK